jgi:hypothetical protein
MPISFVVSFRPFAYQKKNGAASNGRTYDKFDFGKFYEKL